MSMPLSGRWITASRWSDRLDLRPLLDALGGADAFSVASAHRLRAAGFPESFLRAALAEPPVNASDPHVLISSPDYPAPLLDLPRPPPVLWLRGEAGLLRKRGVAIVGARHCTGTGRTVARRMGRLVGGAGMLVVSGGARGIDTEAHLGCCETGATVAILGSGLDAPVTPSARRTRRHILDRGGLLVSEMAPKDPATRWTFPRRNRIIAALGWATVVVEAGRRSGALITARRALELGREVGVVPGPLDAPASAGCLELLSSGARCLRSVGEILDLGGQEEDPLQRLRRALGKPETPGIIAMRLGCPLSEALSLLALLEIEGVVTRAGGGRFALRS